jgi:hypothetical protein
MDRTGSGWTIGIGSVDLSFSASRKLVLDNIYKILKPWGDTHGGNTVSRRAEEEIQVHVFTFFRFRFDVLYRIGKRELTTA